MYMSFILDYMIIDNPDGEFHFPVSSDLFLPHDIHPYKY